MKKKIAVAFLLAIVCFLATTFNVITSNAAENELSGKTSEEIVQMMDKGWNLGNTLDAEGGNRSDVYSQEQSWGNPKVTKELIDGVKQAGFNTIRIPITWYNHVDVNNNYKIDDDFMARVTEIVDYAYDNDLFVIINVHHEKWVNDKDIDKNYLKIGEELVAVWNQIADNFAEYDQHLIFEGMNEPRAKGTGYEWNGNDACYDAVNYLDQLFVTTIRENGKGHNTERALMVPGYAASSNPTVLKSIKIPEYNGEQAKNLIVSVHCYSPYTFCLTDTHPTFDPKNSNDTSDITSLMANLNSLFIKKGIPVVIGECGATNTNDNIDARQAWFTYFGEITKKYGIPAVVWDNGALGKTGGECHNYFYRKTGEMYYPELINCFIYGNVDGKEVKDLVIDFEPYKQGSETVLATPEQYGFEPKLMSKKAKINHTPDASIGYSAVVSVADENSYATLDISKYVGKNVLIKFFVKSKSNDILETGIIDSSTINMISSDIDTNWTQISFSYTCKEDAEVKIYFKGSGLDDFYLDDISITMIEESEVIEPSVVKETSGNEIEINNNEVKDKKESNTNNIKDDKDNGKMDSNSFIVLGITIGLVVIGVCIVIIGVCIVLIIRKKKNNQNK